MNGRGARRRVVLAAGAAAGACVLAAAALRLVPPGDEARTARGESYRRAALRAVDEDVATLRRTAERLQASREFGSIVDGGGAEVRPERLFALLGDALPAWRGWGAVYFDAAGRPAAWAGEAAGLDAERGSAAAGLVTSYHVTRVFVGWVSPRTSGGLGTLVLTRRYPTGIIRPDVVEYLGLPGGPTTLRLRLRASPEPGKPLDFFVEPGSRAAADEDVARRRALPFAALGAALAAVLGIAVRRPLAGLAAARFALLLGMPEGVSGLFAPLPTSPLFLGLFATPLDTFLTGLLALALARAAVRRAQAAAVPRAAALLALPLACVPWLAGAWAGATRAGLFDGTSIVPESAGTFAEATGLLACASAALLGAAVVLSPARPGGRRRFAAALAFACGAAAIAWSGDPFSAPLGCVAGLLAAWSLGARAVPGARADALSRASTAVFTASAATLLFGVGLSHGGMRLADRALERAARSAQGDALASRRAAVALWTARVSNQALEPWLPAAERTNPDDLARALWVRGADEAFPELGDTLTIRSPFGATLSSFGVVRPGRRAPDSVLPTSVPTGFPATFLHVPWPRESDRDPLLSYVASRDVPDRVAVERLEWDAAGRPTGPRGEGLELPHALLERARRSGGATGVAPTAEGARRVRVTAVPGGYAGFAAPVDSPASTLAAAVAAGEAALLVLVPLLAGRRRDGASRGRIEPVFFGTFRARLVALVVLFGAVPLAVSVFIVRIALAGHAASETARRARELVTEGRRVLESAEEGLDTSPEGDLNRAAAVIGTDLLRYRDGRLVAASRALPVSASIARERLSSAVAQALAEGRPAAVAARRTSAPGAPRVVEAAEALSADGRDVLAVVVGEDEAPRAAADGLVLLFVAVALAAIGLGGRAALALGRPLEDLLEATGKVGEGQSLPPLERPASADLARLVDAFTLMSARVDERTQSLARERASAVGLLQSLTAAVVLYRRRDGAVLLSNEAADGLLPGSSLGERLSHPAWAPLRAAVDAASARPSPLETRVAVPGANGERLYRVAIVTLPEEPGEGRAILLLEDLTDFVRADRLAAWVDAARAIAHDIKNPLTPIRLAAERLVRWDERREAAPPGAFAEIAANILRQVAILTERIGRLGRFGDPAALERQRFDEAAVRALVEEVAADFRANERLTLAVGVAPGTPPFLADRLLLRDALVNFVVNAVEAVGERGGRVRLSVQGAALPDGAPGVRFACEDDGPGIAKEAAARIFEPAFSTKSRGSGMGLAAVRRTAERHGGTVFAAARAGGGLEIGFVLPAL